tara:strand:- start:3311 stop:4870 length:1560 start_codon:yes stop_codon:yes gene_type:complete
MKEIFRMAKQAKKALDLIENGKTYTTSYVNNRLETAAGGNPRDILICTMRDVVKKASLDQKFITQKQIAETYDHLYGLGGGRTAFREILGDLLPDKHATLDIKRKDASGSRGVHDQPLNPLFSENEMSKEFEGVFSLDSQPKFSSYGDNTVKKAEKFVKVQLNSLGFPAREVKAMKTNEHFILCSASYDTSEFKQVNVKIPVQISSGIPKLPSHFVQDGGLISLNQENLMVHIKDYSNHVKKTASSKFSQERGGKSLSVDKPVMPSSLEKYADLENELVIAGSNYSREQVKMATSVLSGELQGFGLANPQIKVSASDSRNIAFDVELMTAGGRRTINVPVEMRHGAPILPSKFSSEGGVFDFSRKGMASYLSANKVARAGVIERYSDDMTRISYHELMDKMIQGVASNDYRLAEDALSSIQSRFDQSSYVAALDKFSKMLKHSSKDDTKRAENVKMAFSRGDLINVSTSLEPYCPKLGLPLSKVAFDEKGRVVPMRKKNQAENLEDSGASMSTSRVLFS